MLFSVKLRGTTDNEFKEVLNNTEPIVRDLDEVRNEVSQAIKKKQNKIKTDHDSKFSPAKTYNLNDLVKITKVSFNENP